MPEPTTTLPLYRLAHGRTGDKGNRSNISVIAYHPALWELVHTQVTADAVRSLFADRQPGQVTRHVLPRLQAMNLVLDDVLDGGVNDALNLDSHGKTLCFRVLQMPIAVPTALLPQLQPHLAGPPTDA
ncbi:MULTISPECIES: AtuA-related protein [Comamonas]|jgi:hypothetical protein|uniref:AtuA-like ferredoxin-fold domain-containing protein n=1 Tax=Comamonas terrigena TaxID=32013 RepID=A0A2A7UQH8_COMTR|nr:MULTISPECIES: hypothetical protein [Comamonas]MBD9533798.1 hypothetical protein [Comamonas sp. CMM01]MBV7420517.1 hypothetical protein [Comamonas sp. CMM03]MDH0050646.1 hypothetical protein [Comamonas terrigena]MDH0513102.1 hypothetical protein [Comamonas terrigena]MDH1092570.1 hypothetical protein [Comamonas terrigena]